MFKHSWGKHANKYTGQDIVLVGGGFTTTCYNICQSACYAAVNRAFLYKKIKFDFIFFQDYLGVETMAAVGYRGLRCRKFLGIIDKSVYNAEWVKNLGIRPIPRCYFFLPSVYRYYARPKRFEKDVGNHTVADHGGTALSACQILLYLGFKRLFLVGFDNTFEAHFYGGKIEDFSRQIPFWTEFGVFCREVYPNVEIISVNPVGLKGLFRDVYTREYLMRNPEFSVPEIAILDSM